MKNKFNFKMAILTFFGIIFSLSSFAQYTIQDGDVEVIDGVIESCSYAGGETSIIIPETLDGQTVIGIADKSSNSAVFLDMELVSVQLPTSLEYIGKYAFYGNNLTEIDFSVCPNLERIGESAFNANQISSVDLSNNQSLEIIETSAFFQQVNPSPLTNVDLSDCSSLEIIGNGAFASNNISTVSLNGCTALIELQTGAFMQNEISLINISDCTSLLYIGIWAFHNNPMTGFSLPVNIQYNSFGWVDGNENVFAGGDFVTDMEIDYSVPVTYTIQDADVTIVDGVITSFTYDYYETSITIPQTLQGQTVIGIADNDIEGVFEGNGITEIIFPSTMQFVGDRAFKNNSIVSVDLGECTQFARFGKYAFDSNDIGELLLNCSQTLSLIDDYAFYQNKLGDIDFSGYSELEEIGDYAFYDNNNGYYSILDLSNCSSLETIGGYAFSQSPINEISFDGCSSLRIIGSAAFFQIGITEVDFSELSALEIVGCSAFRSNHLTSVSLEPCTNLFSIEELAFSENSDLNNFQLPDNPDASVYYWKDSDGDTHSGGDNVNDFSIQYVMPVYTLTDDDVTVVDAYITECLIDFHVVETHLVIPDVLDNQPIYGIADGATDGVFEDKGLIRVNLPSLIENIGDYAFKANDITSISFGNTTHLMLVGKEAFADNQLTTLTVSGYSLSVIDEYAFAGNQLTEVNLNPAMALRIIGDYAFSNNSIETLSLSGADQLRFIGQYAFALNTITSFTLPTPDIPGYNFNHWTGTNSASYTGGETVNNLSIGYNANLTSTGHFVTFSVTDGTNPIVGAVVSMGVYGTRATNSAGITLFESVDDGDYYYSVNALGFDEYGTAAAQITMAGANITEDVVLTASTYQIEFNIADGVNPLSGIILTFNGSDYTSDASGYILIEDLLPGIYNYTISDESYLEVLSSVEIVAVDEEVEIALTRIYLVNITVTDGTNPIQGANVNFDGIDYVTNSAGQVFISNLVQGTFDYIVSADDYLTVSDELSVIDDDIEITVELDRVYTLTFDVTDGVDPISGASVTFEGVDYICDVNGQLVLEEVLGETYLYTVTANNYSTVSDEIIIDSDETLSIVLELVYEVEFYISDGVQPIENASLEFDGESYYSNVAGFITIENVPADTYVYQINAIGFQEYTGSLNVIDDDVTEVVSLNSVGVEHISTASISVYPNPTAGQLFFDGIENNVRVEIYNVAGQMMCEQYRDFDFSIDISDYPAGNYVIRLLPENSNMVIKRIVKE